MCDFKIGDIVKSEDNVIFRISQIGYCGLAVFGENLVNNEKLQYSSEEVRKVTFYEMLDFIKHKYMRLIINKPNWVILNCLIDSTSGVTEGISYSYDASVDIVTLYYDDDVFLSNNLYINYDNLDYNKDLNKIEIKKKMNEALDIVEDNIKDAFKKVMIYGEETTVGDFLSKCFKKYKDYILQEEDPVDILEVGDVFEYKDNLYYLLTKSPILSAFEFVDGKRGNHILYIDKDDYRNDYFKNHYTKYNMQDIIEEEWDIDMKKGKLENLLEKDVKRLEPKEDKVFVTVKNKTTIIKWKDGEITKVTYDPKDEYKQTLEKGVLICALRKYFTTGEINKELKWSHTNEDMELGMLIALAKQYFTVDKLNELINKAMESQERDLKKYRTKENKKKLKKS